MKVNMKKLFKKMKAIDIKIIVLFLLAILITLAPITIRKLYTIEPKLIYTIWEPVDMLAYFTSFGGYIGTIVGIFYAIKMNTINTNILLKENKKEKAEKIIDNLYYQFTNIKKILFEDVFDEIVEDNSVMKIFALINNIQTKYSEVISEEEIKYLEKYFENYKVEIDNFINHTNKIMQEINYLINLYLKPLIDKFYTENSEHNEKLKEEEDKLIEYTNQLSKIQDSVNDVRKDKDDILAIKPIQNIKRLELQKEIIKQQEEKIEKLRNIFKNTENLRFQKFYFEINRINSKVKSSNAKEYKNIKTKLIFLIEKELEKEAMKKL